MAGFGRFKLTDALPDQVNADTDDSQPGQPAAPGRGKGRAKGRSKSGGARGHSAPGGGLAAEQDSRGAAKQSGQERRKVGS